MENQRQNAKRQSLSGINGRQHPPGAKLKGCVGSVTAPKILETPIRRKITDITEH